MRTLLISFILLVACPSIAQIANSRKKEPSLLPKLNGSPNLDLFVVKKFEFPLIRTKTASGYRVVYNMPIARLSSNSKMPIYKPESTLYKMPIMKFPEENAWKK